MQPHFSEMGFLIHGKLMHKEISYIWESVCNPKKQRNPITMFGSATELTVNGWPNG